MIFKIAGRTIAAENKRDKEPDAFDEEPERYAGEESQDEAEAVGDPDGLRGAKHTDENDEAQETDELHADIERLKQALLPGIDLGEQGLLCNLSCSQQRLVQEFNVRQNRLLSQPSRPTASRSYDSAAS